MKQMKTHKKPLLGALLIGTLLISPSALASVPQTQSIVDAITQAANAVIKTLTDLAYDQANPYLLPSLVARTQVANTAATAIIEAAHNIADQLAATEVDTAIAATESSNIKEATQAAQQIKAGDSKSAATASMYRFESSVTTDKLKQALKENNLNFNSISLFSPLAYTPIEQDRASNFLQMLKQQMQIPGTLDYAPIRNSDKIKNPETEIQKFKAGSIYWGFLTARRAVIAARSLSMNPIYTLFASRQVQKGYGKQAGMDKTDASELEVRQYLANRRMTKQWYDDMSKASPATVQRETLFILAEMRQQEFKRTLALQQLQATLSSILMQTSRDQAQQLYQMRSTIQEYINNIAKGQKPGDLPDTPSSDPATFTAP